LSPPQRPTAMRASFNNPRISNQIHLPIPRHNSYTEDYVWIFGIEVPESQILGYYTQYRERFGSRWDPNASRIGKLASVSNLLKSITGIKSLTFDLCFPQGMGPTAEDPKGSLRTVVVVTVCNSHRYSYWNRPSQDRLDKLEKFLKQGPPQWFLDSKTKDYY
ncbi:hypothetical protein H0H93_014576, partial [Arthromyces matolae]